MKSFTVVVALALFAVNASAHSSFAGQDVCDVKYHLHESLASVLTHPIGVKTLNEVRQSSKNICTDPKAHNAIVDLLDVITDVTTDPNVSQTLGNALYWVRKLLKEENFRVFWLEEMKGLNMVFENVHKVRQLVDTIFDNTDRLLRSPQFDSSIDRVLAAIAPAVGLSNSRLFNVVAKLGGMGRRPRRPVPAARPPPPPPTARGPNVARSGGRADSRLIY